MTLPENWDVYKKSRNLAKHLWSNGSQMLIRAPTPALRKKQVAACTSCLAIHRFVIMVALHQIAGKLWVTLVISYTYNIYIYTHSHLRTPILGFATTPGRRHRRERLIFRGEMMIEMGWGKKGCILGATQKLETESMIFGETSQGVGYSMALGKSLRVHPFGWLKHVETK